MAHPRDTVYSAVVVAAGHFDRTRSGATMAVSWFGKTELEVGWHAPLFNASKFTDVALRLRLDETDGVQWDPIVLNHSGGGGLGPPPGRAYFRTLGSLENVHQQNFAWKSLHRKKCNRRNSTPPD